MDNNDKYFGIETLEPRIMLSADGLVIADAELDFSDQFNAESYAPSAIEVFENHAALDSVFEEFGVAELNPFTGLSEIDVHESLLDEAGLELLSSPVDSDESKGDNSNPDDQSTPELPDPISDNASGNSSEPNQTGEGSIVLDLAVVPPAQRSDRDEEISAILQQLSFGLQSASQSGIVLGNGHSDFQAFLSAPDHLLSVGEVAGNSILISQDQLDVLSSSDALVIGAEDLSDQIVIGDGDGGPIVFSAPSVILRGDTISVDNDIVANDLVFLGDGSTIPLNANVTDANTVTFFDTVEVNGSRSVQSDQQISFGAPGVTVQGNGGADDDLSLTAGSAIVANISFGGAKPLRDLTLSAGTTINLNQGIDLTRDLTITDATNVTFGGNVTLGGNLTISGVGQVTFNGDLDVAGTITITTEDGSITFNGDIVTGDAMVLTAPEDADISFSGSVDINNGESDLTVNQVDNLAFNDDLTVNNLTQVAGQGNTTFDREVVAGIVDITTTSQISFGDTFEAGGNTTLFAEQIDLGDSVDVAGNFVVTIDGNDGDTDYTINFDDTLDVGGFLALTSLDNVTVDGDANIGQTVNISTEADDITFNGSLISGGDITLETLNSADISIDGNLLVNDGNSNFVIQLTRNATFTGSVSVNDFTITDASGTSSFTQQINANDVTITSRTGIVMSNNLAVTGDVTLFSDEIDFGSNTGSINGTTGSVLTLAPYSPTAATSIDIGSPLSLTGTLDISDQDFRAIATNWDKVVIGHHNTGMGAIRIGTLLVTQTTSIRNTIEFHGGSVSVEEEIELATSGVEYMLLKANDSDGSGVNINAVIGEENTVRNQWIRFESQADVTVSAPVYARERISIATGFDVDDDENNDAGDIVIDHSDDNTGFLETTDASVDGIIELITGSQQGDIFFIDTTITAAGENSIIRMYLPVGSVDGTTDLSTLYADNLSVDAGANIDLNTEVNEILQTTVGARTDISAVDSNVFFGDADKSIDGLQSSISGNITLTNEGSLIVDVDSGGIDAADGTIDITITGEGNDLTLDDAATASSDITFLVRDNIFQNDDIISASGDIYLTATDGNITMADGVTTEAVDDADSGDVTYTAANDIDLSIIDSDGTVTLTATAGSISDNLSTEAANILGDSTKVFLTAATGIGTGTDNEEIDTTIADLTATVTASGGLFIEETDSLNISNDTTGLTVTGPQGDIVIETADGSLTVSGTISTDGDSGNVLLNSREEGGEGTDSALIVNNTLTATGNISLISADGISQSAEGDLTATVSGKTIDLLAEDGIIQVDGTEVTSTEGDIRLSSTSTGDIVIGQLNAGTANVALFNADGSLFDVDDSDAVDVNSGGLLIQVSVDAGTSTNHFETATDTLTALSTGGTNGIFITESDDLIIDRVDVTIDRVAVDGTAASITTDSQEDVKADAGGLVLLLNDGALVVNDGDVAADDTGITAEKNILVQTSEASEGEDDNANITFNEAMVSAAGHISLNSADSILLNTAEADITTEGEDNTIDILAADAITMVDGATLETNSGDISLEATSGDITVGQLLALDASVFLKSTAGSIWDLATDTNDADIRTSDLILLAGTDIGAGDNHLDIEVSNLTTNSGGSNGTFLSELDMVTVAEMSYTVQRIGSDAEIASSPTFTQSDLVSSNDGAIVLVAGDAITLNEGTTDSADAIDSSGNVLIKTTSGAIQINAEVDSAGNVTFDSASTFTQAAAGDITLSTSGKTLQVLSASTLNMADGAFSMTNDGDVRYEATTGDILVGEIIAGSAGVALVTVADSVIDNGDTAGEDIKAASLLINSSDNIGITSDHLEITVDNLSTKSSSPMGTFLTETDGITIDEITVAVNTIDVDGLTPGSTTDITQADMDASVDGAIVLVVQSGNATFNDGDTSDDDGIAVVAADNILLTTENGQLIINEDVVSSLENISLVASDDISLTAEADVNTQTSGKSIDLDSGSDILMGDGASLLTTDGNIRLMATETIEVGDLTAGTASVSLKGTTITDSGSDDTDVTVANLRVEATDVAGGAGESDNHLEVNIDTLTALTGTGGIFVTEADGLIIDTVEAIAVNRIGDDSSIASTPGEDAQSDLVTTGNLVVDVTEGDLTINGGTDDSGLTVTENIRLSTGVGSIALTSEVISSAGSIYLNSATDITQSAVADISTTTEAETIYVLANGAITMTDGSDATSTNGDIRYEAITGNITLAQLVAGTADVAIIATAGSVIDIAGDANDEDVQAATLLITTGTNIGSGTDHVETAVDTLNTKSSGSEGTFITESNALIVDNVSVDVNVVASDAVSTNANATQDNLDASVDGAIVLETTDGTITLNDTVTAADHIRIDAQGTGLLEINEDITSTGGHISLFAADDITLSAAADISTDLETATLDISSGSDILMTDGASISSTNGNIIVFATDTLTVGDLAAGTASVSLKATSITDSGTDDTDVTAANIRIETTDAEGGAGIGTNHLETDVDVLSAVVGTGSLFITELNAVDIEEIAEFSVNRVDNDGVTLTDETISSLSDLTSDKHIVVDVTSGNLTLNEGDDDDTGILSQENVLLKTSDGDIVLNATLTSTAGNITFESSDNFVQAAEGDVLANGAIKTVYALIDGDITMADGAFTQTNNGEFRYESLTGDIHIGQLISGSGNMVILATTGSILDLAEDTNEEDIIAGGLILKAGTDIGQNTNHLDISADSLSLLSSGANGTFLNETNSIEINKVSVEVKMIGTDGETPTGSVSSISSDVTTNGSGSLVLIAGGNVDVTPSDNDNGLGIIAEDGGNILIQTTNSGNITLEEDADVRATTGHISLIANGDFVQEAMADLLAESGTVDILSETGTITMDDNSKVNNEGNVRLQANGDVLIGGILTSSDISIISDTGSILDNGDTYIDLSADEVRLVAAMGVGELGDDVDPLETTIAELTLSTGGSGANILETDGLAVDDVTVTINRVASDASVADVMNELQSDLISSDNGSLVLRSTTGDLIFNDGNATDDATAITVNGTGNVLLETLDGNIDLSAGVVSGSGHLSLIASAVLTQNADGDLTTVDGDIYVSADSISMDDLALSNSGNGDIHYSATNDLSLGGLHAGTGEVFAGALNGSILDNGDSLMDIIADGVILQAGTNIGAGSNHIETTIGTLSTDSAGSEGTFLTESDTLSIGEVSLSANMVAVDASSLETADSSQSDLISTNSGSIVIVTGSTLTVSEGDADDQGVYATGNLLLKSAGNDIQLNAPVIVEGAAMMEAFANIHQAAAGDLSTTSEGESIYLAAGGAISMADGAISSTNNGDIRYQATSGDITVGQLLAGTGDVGLYASTGNILDIAGDTNNADIQAAGLLILAISNIGESSDNIDTSVTNLTTLSTGSNGTFINETDSLNVDEVTVSVSHVATDSSTSAVEHTQNDLTTFNNGVLVVTSGDTLTINDGDANSNGVNTSGNLVLSTTSGDLIVNALVLAASHVKLDSAANIQQTATGDIVLTTDSSTLFAHAMESISMSDGASSNTTNGDIRYEATTGNITVGQLGAGNAGVALVATAGAILDLDTDTQDADVVASELLLSAALTIGESDNHLDTAVDTLAAISTGTFVMELDGVTVDELSVAVNDIAMDGVSLSTVSNTQSDLMTSEGSIVLMTVAGDLTLNDGDDNGAAIHANDHLLLSAGSGGSLNVNSVISSTEGYISLLATQDVVLAAVSEITTDLSGATIEVSASDEVLMSDGASIATTDGNIRIFAVNNIELGDLNAGTSEVSLVAIFGSILDSGTNDTDVTSSKLRISSSNAVGSDANFLETNVETLSASVGSGGIHLEETNGLTIDALEAVLVNRVGMNADLGNVTDQALEDLISAGDIQIILNGGDLVFNGGTNTYGLNSNGRIELTTLAGGIEFNVTLDGSQGLELYSVGTTTFNEAIGSTTQVGDNAGASISITSTGETVFNSTVTAGSGITQSDDAGMITFRDDVTINAGGDTASNFAGNVVLDGLAFTTTDTDLVFGNEVDSVSLTEDAVTIRGIGSSNITSESNIDGSQNLTLNVDGTTTINGDIGSQTPLGTGTGEALVILSTGNTIINGQLFTNSGITQDDNAGKLTLNGNVTLGAGDSDTTLNGDVELGGINLESDGQLNFGNDANDSVVIGTGNTLLDTEISGSNIEVFGDIAGDGNLEIESTGDVTLGGNVTLGGGLDVGTSGGSSNVNVVGDVQVDTLTVAGGTGVNSFSGSVNVTGQGEDGVAIQLSGNKIDFDGDVNVSEGNFVDNANNTTFNSGELDVAGTYTKENDSGETFLKADEIDRIMQNAAILKDGESEVIVITATSNKGISTGGTDDSSSDLFVNDTNLAQLARDFSSIVVGNRENDQEITVNSLNFLDTENASISWETGGELEIEGEILNQNASLSFRGADLNTSDVAVKTGGRLDLIQTGTDTMILDMKVRSINDVEFTSAGDIDLSGMDLLTTGTLTIRAGGSIIVGSAILIATNGVILEADSDNNGTGRIDIASGSTAFVTSRTGDVVLNAAEFINIGGMNSYARIQALGGSLYIDSDSDGNGDGSINVTHRSSYLSASDHLSIGGNALSTVSMVRTTLNAGGVLDIMASSEMSLDRVNVNSGADVTISSEGFLLMTDGEIVTSGNVINLISDADNSSDVDDIIELKSSLNVEADNGNIVMTGVSADIAQTVDFNAQLVTLNGIPV